MKAAGSLGACDPSPPLNGPRSEMPLHWIGRGVLFLAVLIAGVVWGQPQAPISWGGTRLLQNATSMSACVDVFAQGDRIVLLGADSAYITASVSADNGQTWSRWHSFVTEFSGSVNPTVVFAPQALYCCTSNNGDYCGLHRTTDAGASWEQPSPGVYYMRALAARGDTVFCTSWDSVGWTTTGGFSWAPWRAVRPLSFPWIDQVDVSAGYVHAVTVVPSGEHDVNHLFYSRAPLPDGFFEPTLEVNPGIYCTARASMRFDDHGTGVIMSAVGYNHPTPIYCAILRNITRDNGATWSAPDTVTPTQSGLLPNAVVRNCGSMWICVWVDTTRQTGFDYCGLWYQFSANNGRNWYPISQFWGDSTWSPWYVSDVDLQDRRVSLYMRHTTHRGTPGLYFTQVTGQITPDTMAPGLLVESIPPDTVRMGDSLHFITLAADEDTLAEVRVVMRELAGDTLRIPLQRLDGDTFGTSWRVPQEGLFRYRFEAEDFWEHIVSDPDTGWLSFQTTGWINGINPQFTVHPSSFSVQVVPNPSNGWPSIQISPEWFAQGAATMSVYNVLGQKVMEQVVQSDGPIQSAPTASGVYVLRVSNRQRSVLQKFVVLK